jgi:thiol-disulfide isomerase/thioredoxin
MKVIKIGAVWCKDCLVMKPRWASIEKEIPELKTEYFDVDESSEVLDKYEIEDIPAFIFLDKNEGVILKLKGMQNKEKLVGLVRENMDK